MSDKKTIDQLLESLDENVFTKDMKIQMKNALDLKVKALVEEKSGEFEKMVKESSEQYDKKIEEISKEFEEKQKTELNEFKENIIETLDSYLTRIAEEFVEKQDQNILERTIVNEAVEIHKMFDSLMEKYHFSFENVPKQIEKVEVDASLKSELNKAVNEISELKKTLKLAEEKNIKNEKKYMIEEFASKLESVVDKHRFVTLAESFVFVPTEKDEFSKRLETLIVTLNQKKSEPVIKEEKEVVKVQNPKKEGLDEKSGVVIKEELESEKGLTSKKLKEEISKY